MFELRGVREALEFLPESARCVVYVLAASVVPRPADAQTPLHAFVGDQAFDWLISTGSIGDFDGDGCDDVLVGLPGDFENQMPIGELRICSGKTGAVLRTFLGMSPGDGFGAFTVAIGDIDVPPDGVPDVVVGVPFAGGGRVDALSGATGDVMWSVAALPGDEAFGYVLGLQEDMDADGVRDWIAGIPLHDGPSGIDCGQVRVHSGATGAVLLTLDPPLGPFDEFGDAVAGIDDLNNDGVPDVLVGCYADDTVNGFDSGSVRIYAGVSGAPLGSILGAHPGSSFGDAVTSLGDVNGDGRADFAVGAHQDYPSVPSVRPGSARIYSGLGFGLLHVFWGSADGDSFGDSLSEAGDVDGDGVNDLVVGASEASPNGSTSGEAWVFSGANFSTLQYIACTRAGEELGSPVACAGDVNGDGRSDFAVSAFRAADHGAESGSAWVFSGADFARSYCDGGGLPDPCPCGNGAGPCEGCANSTGLGGRLTGGGTSGVLADDLTWTVARLPNQPVLLFAGKLATNAGNGLPFGDGLRCAGQGVVRLGVRQPIQGVAHWGPGIAATGGWVAGDVRYFQGWYRDPNGGPCGTGFNLTQAAEVQFSL